MRVIKKGKKPTPFHGDCRNCGAEVEAERSELKITDDQREGIFGEANCPECLHRMFFYPKQ